MILRFADIAIGNADNPGIASILVKAMITDEPGLRIGADIAAHLDLADVVMPQQIKLGNVVTEELTMLRGLVTLQHDGHCITVGTGECGRGVWMGKDVAEELQLVVKPLQEKQGEACHIMQKAASIPEQTISQLCEYIRTQRLEPIGESYRTTLMAPLEGINHVVNRVLYDVCWQHIEPFYNLEIESWEKPQLIVYREGGIYKPHSDGTHWVRDGEGDKGHWEPYQERDLSLILYLNDAFTGGKLDFPDLKHQIIPKPGLLVTFPSSHSYRHGAEKTESGERIALVTWMRVAGRPSRAKKPVSMRKKSEYAPAPG